MQLCQTFLAKMLQIVIWQDLHAKKILGLIQVDCPTGKEDSL
jgi:hypothetical protein